MERLSQQLNALADEHAKSDDLATLQIVVILKVLSALYVLMPHSHVYIKRMYQLSNLAKKELEKELVKLKTIQQQFSEHWIV